MLAWLRPIALLLAIVAVLMLAASGPGVRFEAWSYRTGLSVFRWSAYLAIACALCAVVVLAAPGTRRLGIAAPLLALILGLTVFYVPFQFQRQARSVPPLKEIST